MLTNRQVTLQNLLDKLSEGYCVKTHVMTCIGNLCPRRPGGERKVHILGSDGRLLFYCLLASFTGMVQPSDTPYLTLLWKLLFIFVISFLCSFSA